MVTPDQIPDVWILWHTMVTSVLHETRYLMYGYSGTQWSHQFYIRPDTWCMDTLAHNGHISSKSDQIPDVWILWHTRVTSVLHQTRYLMYGYSGTQWSHQFYIRPDTWCMDTLAHNSHINSASDQIPDVWILWHTMFISVLHQTRYLSQALFGDMRWRPTDTNPASVTEPGPDQWHELPAHRH